MACCLRAISQDMSHPSITKIELIITHLEFHLKLPETNEFKMCPKILTVSQQIFFWAIFAMYFHSSSFPSGVTCNRADNGRFQENGSFLEISIKLAHILLEDCSLIKTVSHLKFKIFPRWPTSTGEILYFAIKSQKLVLFHCSLCQITIFDYVESILELL